MIVCPWKDIGRYAPVIPGLEEAVAAVAALESYEPRTFPLSRLKEMPFTARTSPELTLKEVHRSFT